MLIYFKHNGDTSFSFSFVENSLWLSILENYLLHDSWNPSVASKEDEPTPMQ